MITKSKTSQDSSQLEERIKSSKSAISKIIENAGYSEAELQYGKECERRANWTDFSNDSAPFGQFDLRYQ